MLEQLIVHAAVLAATLYTGWRLMPDAWRAILRRVGRKPASEAAARQERRPAACGSCSACSSGRGATIIIKTIREDKKC